MLSFQFFNLKKLKKYIISISTYIIHYICYIQNDTNSTKTITGRDANY